MRERVVTGVILALVLGLAVYFDFYVIYFASFIFCMIGLEVLYRQPFNHWSLLALLQALGVLFVMYIKPTDIIFVAIIVVLNDTMAYFGGKYLNFCNLLKINIFPKSSPKKTLGGLIYGITFSVLGALVYSKYYVINTGVNIIVLSIIIAIFAVIGDNIESRFKRNHKVKDSGQGLITEKILKGHGGFYDRFDAVTMSFWGWFLVAAFY